MTNGTHKDHSGKPIVALLPGGHGNAQWWQLLDVVAAFCNGVSPRPVLFRPFHENLGPWNWWGSNASSPAQCRAAWNYTLAYLRGSKGVHNALSVYSPDKPSDYFADWRDLLERFPGDDLVDVVAFDHYDTLDGNYSASLVQCCRMVAQLAASRSKVAAVAEFGSKHGSENITRANAGWYADKFLAPIAADALASRVAYAMTWTNRADTSWVLGKEQAAFAGFKRFYDSELTLFSRDLPNSTDAALPPPGCRPAAGLKCGLAHWAPGFRPAPACYKTGGAHDIAAALWDASTRTWHLMAGCWNDGGWQHMASTDLLSWTTVGAPREFGGTGGLVHDDTGGIVAYGIGFACLPQGTVCFWRLDGPSSRPTNWTKTNTSFMTCRTCAADSPVFWKAGGRWWATVAIRAGNTTATNHGDEIFFTSPALVGPTADW